MGKVFYRGFLAFFSDLVLDVRLRIYEMFFFSLKKNSGRFFLGVF